MALSIGGAGTDEGGNWIDIAFSGTPTSTRICQFRQAPAPASAVGQVWTAAATLQTQGAISGVNNIRVVLRENAGGASSNSTGTVGPLTSATRRSVSRTLGALGPLLEVEMTGTIGVAASGVLRVWQPQLERTAAPTAYIATTGTPASTAQAPRVHGTATPGGFSIRGWAPEAEALLPGDLIGWTDATGRSRLHMATAAATAAENGICTAALAPPLRSLPADNTALDHLAPACIWRLSSDASPWDIAQGLMGGGTLDIEEALV
jgi:hypothetical protein